MSRTILITGFEPFKQWAVNSSEQVVRAVGAMMPARVRAEVIPVDHLAAHRRMVELLERERPVACLAMGLWSGSSFRIERFGRRCPGLADVEGAEEFEGAWPWGKMEGRLAEAGRPVSYSEDAGKYVCDTTYWTLLDYRSRRGYPEYAAFLHLPPVSEEFSVELMAGAVRGVIEGISLES